MPDTADVAAKVVHWKYYEDYSITKTGDYFDPLNAAGTLLVEVSCNAQPTSSLVTMQANVEISFTDGSAATKSLTLQLFSNKSDRLSLVSGGIMIPYNPRSTGPTQGAIKVTLTNIDNDYLEDPVYDAWLRALWGVSIIRKALDPTFVWPAELEETSTPYLSGGYYRGYYGMYAWLPPHETNLAQATNASVAVKQGAIQSYNALIAGKPELLNKTNFRMGITITHFIS